MFSQGAGKEETSHKPRFPMAFRALPAVTRPWAAEEPGKVLGRDLVPCPRCLKE